MFSINCWQHSNARSGRAEDDVRGEGGLNTVRSAGTCVTSFPLLRFSQRSLGSRPTKQLVSMGIPAPAFHEDTLPASSASAAGPARRGGQVYFLPGGPFEVAVRPLPHRGWCIRWGSREGRRWDSFIATSLHLCREPGRPRPLTCHSKMHLTSRTKRCHANRW